jgi:uncharacterized protein
LATDSIALSQPSLPTPKSTVAGAWHTIFLLALVVPWSAWGYFGTLRMRAAQNPHRVAMYVLTILWEWAVVAYIAWGAKRHGSSLGELIGGKWNDWKAFLKDIAVAVGFWLIALVVLGAASLALQATKASQNIRVLLPQSQLEVFLWILTSITAGVCEEIIFRGYFQRQFSAWTGNAAAGVLLSAAAFGAGHIYQGWRSAIVVLVYGSLFGILAEARESLRPGMMTHAWHDGFVGLVGRLVVK